MGGRCNVQESEIGRELFRLLVKASGNFSTANEMAFGVFLRESRTFDRCWHQQKVYGRTISKSSIRPRPPAVSVAGLIERAEGRRPNKSFIQCVGNHGWLSRLVGDAAR